MSKSTTKDYAVALYEATKELMGRDLELALQNFVQLLFKKQQLKKAERIINDFIAYHKKQEGIIDIEITSARKLDTKVLDAVKKAFGDTVEAIEKIDESLIGGIKVKTEDKIFDGSLRTQLVRLKQQLQ